MYNAIDQRSSSHVNTSRQPVTDRTAGTSTAHTLSTLKAQPQVRAIFVYLTRHTCTTGLASSENSSRT
jgi:hypothetical protein